MIKLERIAELAEKNRVKEDLKSITIVKRFRKRPEMKSFRLVTFSLN